MGGIDAVIVLECERQEPFEDGMVEECDTDDQCVEPCSVIINLKSLPFDQDTKSVILIRNYNLNCCSVIASIQHLNGIEHKL